ncbi:PREDICTED: uncharacterized protein LOC109351301 [Lupinus angustifolius]|uniref:uncharacterized protein LOC109351301 n=1 Tax=Lupinus angustifolius TaxID=3871 RepID=UPI00092E3748|nr:PREDICTED: uncharacterized protein LOC109351301 [Lupinus angustifolius]
MGSLIRVNSISIDLNNSTENTDRGKKCQHFSLRGYVSNMRNKDWKKCWPFHVLESEKRPSFPPMDVPKFRWWTCDICQQAAAAEGNDNKDDDQTDLSNYGDAAPSSGIQQAPMPESVVVRRDIDLNIPIDLSSGSDFLPIDPEIGLENNLNLQVSSIPSPEVCPDTAQETHKRKRVHEGDEVSDVEPVASNVNIEHPMRPLHPESVACTDAVPTGNTGNIVEDNIQDHCPLKSIRKKRRKMRLITDLLSVNQEPRSEPIAEHGSTSHPPSDVHPPSNIILMPDKVNVHEGMTLRKKGHSRKRKFLPDDESKKPADMCFQRIENDVQNPDGDDRTVDTVPDDSSEDVLVGMSLQDGMKDHQQKPELQISRTMGKKDVVEKEDASTEKGMDSFVLQASRIENECNFSKGKGKMLHANEELDSLSSWRNRKLVENTFAHTRATFLPNMHASVPIPSAQGAPNGEGLKEGLNLSLNCYSSAEACNIRGICQTNNGLSFSLPEGSSNPQLIREESEPDIFGAPSHITKAISGKGKGVHLKEIDGARNKAKSVQFYDLTVEEPEEEACDDMPMEVVELMARNQYIRSLPDVENRSSLLDNSTQMANHRVDERTNGADIREGNMLPAKRNSANFFYPYGGNQFGLNSLCKTQPHFGVQVLQSKNKPPTGLYFSPMDTRKFGPHGTSQFNRIFAERGSSDAALQARGGSNMWNSIKQQECEASRPWPTLTRCNASLGFDVAPRNIVSQPTSSSNIDTTFLQSGSVHTIPAMNLHNLMGAGRQSTSFNAGVRAQMLQRSFYPSSYSNNLKIGSSISDRNSIMSGKGESSKSGMQSGVSKQFSQPNIERELKELVSRMNAHSTHVTSGPSSTINENLCMINRNPADFTVSEERNAYMINSEDLHFEKSVPEERYGLPAHGCKLKRNQKGKMKEHEKD